MITMTREVPLIHPGIILAEDWLAPLGLSQYALAKAIVALYEDPDLRFKMGQANRSRVLDRHVFNPAERWPF